MRRNFYTAERNPCSLYFILLGHFLMASHTCLKTQTASWKKAKAPRRPGQSVQLTTLYVSRAISSQEPDRSPRKRL